MDTSHEMILLIAATIMLLGSVTSVAGEIRCYCNDASCVRSGYMCKSAMGRCFSQLTYERDSTRSVHGCAESLPLEDQEICDGSRNIAEAKTGDRVQWPILLCCKNDMCNYMDNLDINIYVTKSNGSKDSVWIGSTGETDADDVVVPGAPPYAVSDKMTSQRDLWFKAAVIAVPIAGGFILILLVLLAVRVLKNDNRRHRQLMQMRHHRSMTKAQLYVADHFYHNELLDSEQSSNNTHCHNFCNHKVGVKAKLAPSPRNSVHDSSCPGNGPGHVSVKTSNVYRDVHIKIDNSKHRYEKIRPISDSSSILEAGSCNSIILWGDPKKPDVAATV